MKKTLLKRIVAMMLVLMLSLTFAACKGSSEAPAEEKNNKEYEEATKPADLDVLEDDDLSYVLIYNPNIYNPNTGSTANNLETGYLGTQIDTDSSRADGLEEEEDTGYATIAQGSLPGDISLFDVEIDANKADPMGVDYEEGDEHEFFYGYPSNTDRDSQDFECVYAGEYCYVWSDGSADESDLIDYGEEFDDNIYEDVVEEFGQPRFVGETGKVNLLFYPFDEYGVMGFFANVDGFAEGELEGSGGYEDFANYNHAIIHFNTEYLSDEDLAYPTMAHEFQHLINFSNAFKTVQQVVCDTWLNEAMSGYIEEKLYPGSKEAEGHISSFNKSKLIRNGQSMYNFATTSSDIGVYGSVYYFTEYLKDLAGDDVFVDFSEYWTDSYSDTLHVAEALENSVSTNVANEVNKIIDYGDAIDFDSESEEWMSKLVLNFYLTLLSKDTDIDAFEGIKHSRLLFDDIDGADIEGGGRIIVSVDGSFEIPEDADNGLVYVGLDEDFNVITEFVFK